MTIAVVLFNLGGPDSQAAVQPFLFNLFNDPAIIRLPQPFRWLIAKLISSRRTKTAQGIYAQMGGRSPILPETEAQAQALEILLNAQGKEHFRVFSCMRYWHPRAEDVLAKVNACKPKRIILLPLYPQFSTTTTASSVREWQHVVSDGDGTAQEVAGCYFTHPKFVEAHAEKIDAALQEANPAHPLRLLFSAHGLPKKVVDAGDPYQWQVEQGVAAIVQALRLRGHEPETRISFQSRVGPMEWIGPSTEHEIEAAGKEGVGLMIVPIAFVSEHSETLVELDIEYRHLAEKAGVPVYTRIPALGTHPLFIETLADLVRARVQPQDRLAYFTTSHRGHSLCPPEFTECACRGADKLPELAEARALA